MPDCGLRESRPGPDRDRAQSAAPPIARPCRRRAERTAARPPPGPGHRRSCPNRAAPQARSRAMIRACLRRLLALVAVTGFWPPSPGQYAVQGHRGTPAQQGAPPRLVRGDTVAEQQEIQHPAGGMETSLTPAERLADLNRRLLSLAPPRASSAAKQLQLKIRIFPRLRPCPGRPLPASGSPVPRSLSLPCPDAPPKPAQPMFTWLPAGIR